MKKVYIKLKNKKYFLCRFRREIFAAEVGGGSEKNIVGESE